MLTDYLSRFLLLPELSFRQVRFVKGVFTAYCFKTSKAEKCPSCFHTTERIYDHRICKTKDSPIRNKAVDLVIEKRRFECKSCRKVFTEQIPGILRRKRTTQRLKAQIFDAIETYSTMTSVAKKFSVSVGYTYQVGYEMLELERRKCLYPWPKAISLDEHKFKRGRGDRPVQFVTNVVDHKGHRIMEVVEGKDRESLSLALAKIPNPENVYYVTIDMSETYLSFVKSFFKNASCIVDKFHVIQLFTKLINRLRIDASGDDRKNPIRKLLLRNGKDLEKHEGNVLQFWLDQHPSVKEIYAYKEAILRFYRCRGRNRAKLSLTGIVKRMELSKLESIKSLRSTLVRWRVEILAYFSTGLTNAIAEGFNRVAKLIQRKAFGVRSFKFYRLKLLNATR